MRPETKYTPFDGNIVITLLDADLEPLALTDYEDVEIHLFLNGTEKLRYKTEAADAEEEGGLAWLAWQDAEATDGNEINCPVTIAQTANWRGLVNAVTVLVKDGQRHEPIVKVLFLAAKSGV